MARFAALFVLVAAAAAAAAVALAASSPKSLRHAIFAAARKERSVHYIDVGGAQGLRQTIVGDAAGTRGRQQISITLQGRKGRFTVLVVSRVAYLRGDTFALHAYIGFTAAQASRYQGRWISVPPSSGRYKDLAASVTLPSFLQDIYPGAPLALVTTKIGATAVTGVRGTTREDGLRFVVAVFPNAKLLPHEVVTAEKNRGFLDATKISRWNERVRVTAPAHAVPIATVLAS